MKMKHALLGLMCFLLVSCSSTEGDSKNSEIIDSSPKIIIPVVPKSMKFADQQIEFNNFDVRERLDKELIVNTYYHSSTVQAMKRASRFFPLIEDILKQQGIPTDFKYLCLIESNLLQATSPSGAKGFWQFMPETAMEYGLEINDYVDERLHIEKSTLAACDYLNAAYEEFGDWMLTAAAYNKGTGGIKRDLENQKVKNYFDLHLNTETSRYVFRILAMKLIFESPANYGFELSGTDLYSPIPYKKLKCTESINSLSDWAQDNGTNLRMLKVLNPWILNNSLPIKNDTVTILIPTGE